MHYWRAFSFAFKSPKWPMQLLFAILCQLVPVAGQMVFIGYSFEIIEYMHRRNSMDRYPDFDTNRLVKYLLRGAWPFLAHFVLGLFSMPAGFVAVGAYFLIILAAGGRVEPELAVIVSLIAFVLILVTSIVLTLVATPIYLRAGLIQDFAPAFSYRFVKDFIGRVGGTIVLVFLFELVTFPFVILAGMLLCYIGIFPASAIVAFAQIHFLYLLYQIYLERGGEPIPLKPMDVEKAEPPEEIVDTDGGDLR